MNAEMTLAADCSASCVVPQHMAAYVVSTLSRVDHVQTPAPANGPLLATDLG